MEEEREYIMGFGNNIDGYDKLVEKRGILELRGKDVQSLKVGMMVELIGDSKGYVRGVFHPGDKVVIIGFPLPGTDHHLTEIVLVSDGERISWVTPANIKKDSIVDCSFMYPY